MENEQENQKQIEVITSIKSHNPELIRNCYAVGLWLWAEFQNRLSQEEVTFLKEIGFRWNKARKVWQNACGAKSRASAGDPRQKYQIVRFDD
jgi:hypothetical protein